MNLRTYSVAEGSRVLGPEPAHALSAVSSVAEATDKTKSWPAGWLATSHLVHSGAGRGAGYAGTEAATAASEYPAKGAGYPTTGAGYPAAGSEYPTVGSEYPAAESGYPGTAAAAGSGGAIEAGVGVAGSYGEGWISAMGAAVWNFCWMGAGMGTPGWLYVHHSEGTALSWFTGHLNSSL